MERSSKLADLKLVSKYYPVTNYSYPQQPERPSHYVRSRFSDDRASLGSEGSSPSLIDDRTDSEVSLDDDYQYHAHGAELWDSFWLPSKSTKLELQPRNQCPVLGPTTQQQQHQKQQQLKQQHQRRQKQTDECRINAWPLDGNSRNACRKPATYSPFPKPLPLPPRTSPQVPSWQCSRDVKQKPQRPPRPHEEVYIFRSLQNSPLVAHFTVSQDSPRPITPKDSRPTTAQEMRLPSPTERDSYSETASRHSAKHLCSTNFQPPASVILPKKSLPCMRPLPPTPPPEAEETAKTEPHSVFEYDDSDTESEGRSFWFHRRSGSDQRKTGHRTAPSSPRKRQNDVIGRMLGRRSRG
ncbi:hypothetical protein FLONG3_8577 [Fusarium longipes]|uniref:Uncharacterized protein n=1 Tax=Fusarium longipes TaxID=694270 RepID=A0A395S4Y1_9HYPO|nr:hypothetical protein FLONG3_8577 [Fusarium longipes]